MIKKQEQNDFLQYRIDIMKKREEKLKTIFWRFSNRRLNLIADSSINRDLLEDQIVPLYMEDFRRGNKVKVKTGHNEGKIAYFLHPISEVYAGLTKDPSSRIYDMSEEPSNLRILDYNNCLNKEIKYHLNHNCR